MWLADPLRSYRTGAELAATFCKEHKSCFIFCCNINLFWLIVRGRSSGTENAGDQGANPLAELVNNGKGYLRDENAL
jgi:hypothetical protein